jgi:GcrA cell cycle regulator
MEWTEAVIAELRRLWAEGLSTAEIGRRLGVTKNAIVGKAHRLALDPRPSPIRRTPREGAAAPAPRRVQGPTLPPLAHVAPPVSEPPMVRMPPPVSVQPQIRQAANQPFRSGGRVTSCCWPIGEPGTSSFHFCGSDSMQGKPYCSDHAQLAYVKVRDRREDAA